jgi:ABC-2 type transport system permease protein
MTLFWKLTSLAFKQEQVYRTAMVAGLATNLFFGVLRALFLIALYAQRGEVNQLTLGGAVTFVALTQALIAFLRAFGSYDLMQSVYNGSIGADLLKPLNLYVLWLGKDLGRSALAFWGRGVVFMLIFGLFFPLQVPSKWEQWGLFFAALVMSWMISFSFRFLVNLAAFWSPDAQGFGRAAYGAELLLAGFYLPLRLLPDWFSRFCQLTFFPSIVNTPAEIFLGTLQGTTAVKAVCIQIFWTLIFLVLCQFVLRAGIRRLVIQGG